MSQIPEYAYFIGTLLVLILLWCCVGGDGPGDGPQ